MSVSKSSVPESGAPEAGVNVGGDEMVKAREEPNCAIIAQASSKNLLFMGVVHLPPISPNAYDGVAGATTSADFVPPSEEPIFNLMQRGHF